MLDASHQARDSRGTAETWIAIRGAALAAILSTPAHAPCPGLGTVVVEELIDEPEERDTNHDRH